MCNCYSHNVWNLRLNSPHNGYNNLSNNNKIKYLFFHLYCDKYLFIGLEKAENATMHLRVNSETTIFREIRRGQNRHSYMIQHHME
jgi:hypothetical protein